MKKFGIYEHFLWRLGKHKQIRKKRRKKQDKPLDNSIL